MRDSRLALVIASTLSLWSGRARANQNAEPVAPSLPDPGAETETDTETGGEADLQSQLEELRGQLRRTEEELHKESPLSINGYVDFGFFAPIGNKGAGWIRDTGNKYFPAYSNYSWTFLGDILATPVNTRGEVASLNNAEAPGVNRFDSVNSNGAPGFIANEFNLRVGYQLAENAILRTSVNFVPRTATQDFALGDFVDVDLAEMEYLLTRDGKTSIFVGKVMPVFGIEYKERKSDQRFGITPSLVQRYTSGSQLGLKFRSKLLDDWIILAGAVTNNSSTTEQFHFYSEIDRNSGKMLSGRAALNIPVGELIPTVAGSRLEIGGSGEWGSQDRATDDAGKMWFWGIDVQYLSANFALKGQYMRGGSPGKPDAKDGVWGLKLHDSGYVELNWLFLPYLGVIGRAEVRDALVTLGTERAYITKQQRFTGGLRGVINSHIVLKAEFLHNREFGGVPQFKDDVFTSSLVLSF